MRALFRKSSDINAFFVGIRVLTGCGQFTHEFQISAQNAASACYPFHSASDEGPEIRDHCRLHSSVRRIFRHRLRERMLASELNRISKLKQLLLSNAFRGHHIGHDGLSCSDRARLVQSDYLGPSGSLQSRCGLIKNSVLRAHSVSDHYRNGSRKS